jgi:hypothetical protein
MGLIDGVGRQGNEGVAVGNWLGNDGGRRSIVGWSIRPAALEAEDGQPLRAEKDEGGMTMRMQGDAGGCSGRPNDVAFAAKLRSILSLSTL